MACEASCAALVACAGMIQQATASAVWPPAIDGSLSDNAGATNPTGLSKPILDASSFRRVDNIASLIYKVAVRCGTTAVLPTV